MNFGGKISGTNDKTFFFKNKIIIIIIIIVIVNAVSTPPLSAGEEGKGVIWGVGEREREGKGGKMRYLKNLKNFFVFFILNLIS